MKVFKVTFKDKASGIERVYKPHSQDEPTVWQWVDRQREVFQRAFIDGSMIITTNPKNWKVAVEVA